MSEIEKTMSTNKQKGELDTTKSNFGFYGWIMIIYAGFLLFYAGGTLNDGLNVIVHNIAHANNLDPAQLLFMATPAGWVGIIGSIVWAIFVGKTGPRLGALVIGVLGGISFMLYGIVHSVTGFLIVTSLCNFMAFGYAYVVASTLMANWFPIKKGLALGWATMGQNLATAFFVPLMILFITWTNLSGSFYIMGGSLVLVAIIGWFIIRDLPEEKSCSPDNGNYTQEEIEQNLKEIREYKSPWTPKKLIFNKQIWLIGLAYGIFILVTVSMVSQLIPRLMSYGWPQHKAVGMMTVAAILGVIGSYATGWLDQKFTTRVASIIYGFWYLIACILCTLPPNNLTIYASIFFAGIGIGGIGNLFPSMTATVFGRYDFVRALGVLNPITAIVRSFAFAILGFGLSRLGGYAGAYAIIAALDVLAIIMVYKIDDTCIGKN